MPLAALSMDALVNANGVFFGHYLGDGRRAHLLATLLVGAILLGPGWKERAQSTLRKGKQHGKHNFRVA